MFQISSNSNLLVATLEWCVRIDSSSSSSSSSRRKRSSITDDDDNNNNNNNNNNDNINSNNNSCDQQQQQQEQQQHRRRRLLLLLRSVVLKVCQYSMLSFAVLISIVYIGVQKEQYYVHLASDTIQFYNQQSNVCAFSYPTSILGNRPKYSSTSSTTKTSSTTMSTNSHHQHQHRQHQHHRTVVATTVISSATIPGGSSNNNINTNNINNNDTVHLMYNNYKNYNNVSALQYNNLGPINPIIFESFASVQHAKKSNRKRIRKLRASNTTATATTETVPSNNDPNNNDNDNNDDIVIAHCGECGACSNPHDINLYDVTKKTLYGKTLTCAKYGLLFGRESAKQCMENNVGLTAPCNNCWIDNIMCDFSNCIFTCIWHNMLTTTIDGITNHELNPCTMCDERMCGPQFITCAGANRRRSGILSDIERNQNTEVCTKQDPLWWTDTNLRYYYYDSTNKQQQQQL